MRGKVLTVQFARLRTVELTLASTQVRRQNHLTFNYQEADEMPPPITAERDEWVHWGPEGGWKQMNG